MEVHQHHPVCLCFSPLQHIFFNAEEDDGNSAIQSVSSYWFSHSVSFQHDLCPLSTELSKLQTTSVMSWLLTKNVDLFKGDVMGLCFVFKKSSLVNICLTEMYVLFFLH